MPDILFLSDNEVFKQDLIDQLKHHAPEFSVSTEKENTPDVVIIDENPKLVENCRAEGIKAPLIFLNNGCEIDSSKVAHVINKPFYLSSFLDTVQASINIYENSKEGSLTFNQYVLYPSRKEILNIRNREITKLTEKEVCILKYLYKNKDKIVNKNDLMQEVWEYAADATTHTVETHIYRLRQKVEKEDETAQLILTSDGGYQLIV